MTVPSDVNKHIYAGNGVTRVWPYTFLLYDASHLQVWVKRGDEESALLERGYVLALDSRGVPFKRAADRRGGERISLMFADGKVNCEVTEVLVGRP